MELVPVELVPSVDLEKSVTRMTMTIDQMPTLSLKAIAEKVQGGKRLSPKEGLYLLERTDPKEIEAVGILANSVRKERVGDVVTFANSYMFYPTNLCELNCQFCSFYAKPGWDKAWLTTPEQAEEKIRFYHEKGLNEVHIVGGLWRECNLDYYEDLFARIKGVNPKIHIKALTPVEYDFLAKLHNISIEEVFKRMISWGLGSLPGGGAEILVEEIREKLAPGKITSDEFMAIHKLAHSLDLRTNITMLFNHIEKNEDIITHLMTVRDLQDETGGFKTFVPLKFGEEDNALGKRKKRLNKKSIPLVYATSRLMLDNIPNLKILWNYLGVEEGLELLHYGGNDFSSTNLDERVILMAGGTRAQMDVDGMSRLIRSQGRVPRLTNSEAV
ncbi:MAG: Aminodeoxyfutalosine synthase [Chlamydiales bacterium]|nr:Aminodeoxyfutalosine synthase [Chlamydiales bacterium]MCH9620084.1 Aminodeoxyfutalosine synthase [Chlamydiales bacterium]MCH9623037.1 Aminodeoxyfutalosine synthase [Chlamydiales bacterium]